MKSHSNKKNISGKNAEWEDVKALPDISNGLVLYHGSDHVLVQPQYNHPKASDDNDYGKGFYTTQDLDKACAWAVTMGTPDANVVNRYVLDLNGLEVFNFAKTGILAWCAEIISHRGEDLMALSEGPQMFINKYKLNTDKADIIIGYRADDSYMSIVEAFFNKVISIEEMERMFYIGELGEQVFIKSPAAFDQIHFTGYKDKIENIDLYLEEDRTNRQKAEKWLKNRRTQIDTTGFVPQGITAPMCIQNTYVFNKEYGFYELGNIDTPDISD